MFESFFTPKTEKSIKEETQENDHEKRAEVADAYRSAKKYIEERELPGYFLDLEKENNYLKNVASKTVKKDEYVGMVFDFNDKVKQEIEDIKDFISKISEPANSSTGGSLKPMLEKLEKLRIKYGSLLINEEGISGIEKEKVAA